MIQIVNDFKIRNFLWDDLPEIVDLMNISMRADNIEGEATLEEEEHMWRSPEINPEHECTVVRDSRGRLVAFAVAEAPRQPNKGYGDVTVHPDVRNTNIGNHLIQMTDKRLVDEIVAKVDPELPISVQRWVSDTSDYYRQIITQEGYSQVRRFYTMRINLDHPLEPTPMPEGFELRPFDPAVHARAVYDAVLESFRDHWGHTHTEYDLWYRGRIEEPKFRANMWYIAWDTTQERVAGASLSLPWGEDMPDLAWLATLGVRRDYRKRGLGEALLKHSFWHYQQLGYKRGGLGVDADNPTKALALYERAGMHVHRYGDIYRKAYRGRLEDVKDF